MDTSIATVLAQKGKSAGQVESVEPSVTVAEAVSRMNNKKIGALLVCSGKLPVGIFTERDVLVRVVAAGKDPKVVTVAQVMTSKLVVIAPKTSVQQVMTIMTEKRCRHLPVMEGEELKGLVSIGDVTRWMTRDLRYQVDDLVRYITGVH